MKKPRKAKTKKHAVATMPRAGMSAPSAKSIQLGHPTRAAPSRTPSRAPSWSPASASIARQNAKAAAAAYSTDDRETILLLALPFLLIACVMAMSQANRRLPDLEGVALRKPAIEMTAPKPVAANPPTLNPPASNPDVARRVAIATKPAEALTPAAAEKSSEIAARPASQPSGAEPGARISEARESAAAATAPVAVAPTQSAAEAPAMADALKAVTPTAEGSPSATPAQVTEAPVAAATASGEQGRVEIAALDPREPAIAREPPVTEVTPPPPPAETVCRASAAANMRPRTVLGSLVPASNPEAFGLALAAAAREQLDDFIIYTDKYYQIGYPLGDIPALYGVCTDVIVRAYRAVGYDLQQLVQETRSGAGDKNIDHRRVDTLRKFFAKHGENLPITEFGEDYKPGDIVSYYRPQNRHSRTHIAVVSDMVGPSGRPMIIHNRGWGPQQEDALFVDQITGHYRFTGARMTPAPASVPAVAARPPKTGASPPATQAQRKAAAKTDAGSVFRASLGGVDTPPKPKATTR